MIAKNFVKYPEALRFQCEMFSNGYHNSPRIMRLMECVFDWSATVPDWWKEAKGRARDLAKRVRKSINDFFKDVIVQQLSLTFEPQKTPNEVTEMLRELFSEHRGGAYTTPNLKPYWGNGNKQWNLACNGGYRNFCPYIRHAMVRGGFEYSEYRA